MDRLLVTRTITRTLIICAIAIGATAIVLYLLGQDEIIGTGAIVAAIVSFLIASVSSYRTLRLIHELENVRKDLEDVSTHDYLTGIYNRRFLVEQAATILALGVRHGFPVSLIMIDIDHFKQVNDTHGHAKGDAVLVEMASFIRGLIRETDIFGRYGGEEFIVFMPHTSLEDAVKLADRIREGVKDRTFGGCTITLSMGVSVATPRVKTLEDLIDRADVALYEAKNAGRDRVAVSKTATA